MTGARAQPPRDTLRAVEVLSLMARHPLLSRCQIEEVMSRVGRIQSEVETELARLSRLSPSSRSRP